MIQRRLPNLICPGAQKSGTTTLFDILVQHPEIYKPKIKEQHFFDLNYDKGMNYYSQFYEEVKDEKYIPDFSPFYLPLRLCT